jgi:hypothetical protein
VHAFNVTATFGLNTLTADTSSVVAPISVASAAATEMDRLVRDPASMSPCSTVRLKVQDRAPPDASSDTSAGAPCTEHDAGVARLPLAVNTRLV